MLTAVEMPSLDGTHRFVPRTRPTLAAATALLLAFGAGAASAGLEPVHCRGPDIFALAELAPPPQDAAPPPEGTDVADARRIALVRAACVVVRVLLVAAVRAGVMNVRLR